MSGDLPLFELGWPGPMRDQLVGAVLAGAKTATSSLRVFYDLEDEALPVVGMRSSVVDSNGDHVAIVETMEVRQMPLIDVDVSIAVAEGEGFHSVAEWRAAHEVFWREVMTIVPGGATVQIDDTAIVVVELFRVVAT
jgi:uncharacterized protein YhfF